MAVVEATIQTVEDIYRLVWSAAASRRPIGARYKKRPRLFCPHRLGRNGQGELRVLCYQYGGESESGIEPAGSPANWRCIVLEKLSQVRLLTDVGIPHRIIRVLPRAWSTPTSTLTITARAIHKRGSEGGGRTGAGQSSPS